MISACPNNQSGFRSGQYPGSSQRQRGLSMISLILILCVAVFFGLFAFKAGPAYLEFMTVRQVARDAASNTDLMKQPQSKVLGHIDDAYRMNNLWEMKAKETITLAKDKSRGYIVTVDYEKRTNLLFNIDLVTVFQEDVSAL